MVKYAVFPDALANIGDFALLLQTVEGLKLTSTTNDVVMFYWDHIDPHVTQKLLRLGIGIQRRNDLIGAARTIRGRHVVIPGGQMIRDQAGQRSLLNLLFLIHISRISGGKTFLINVGAGLIRRPIALHLWKWVVFAADYVSVRDSQSQLNLERISSSIKKIHSGVDSAFLPTSLHAGLQKVVDNADEYILVAPCRDNREERSVNPTLLARCISSLKLPTVKKVVVVSHDPRDDMDPAICREIREALEKSVSDCEIKELAATDLGEICALYASSSLVVSNRLHAVIFALIADKPVLVIDDGNPKITSVSEDFGLATVKLKADSDPDFTQLKSELLRCISQARISAVQSAKTVSAQPFLAMKQLLH